MTRTFSRAAIATPHHLASAAGQAVLNEGGNAVDAAIAANLVLAVVTPYHCGVGGDLFSLVWDGRINGVASAGRAPAAASPAAIREAVEAHDDGWMSSIAGTSGMPRVGPLTVTVPGAVAGWYDLLERWGSRSFGDLATRAVGYAREGFVVSPNGEALVERASEKVTPVPGFTEHFGGMRAHRRFVQPELADTLTAIAEDGPDAFYRGEIAERIVTTLRAGGSTMSREDFAAHRVERLEPLLGTFRGLEIAELPPPTQGVTALTALGVLEAFGDLPVDESAAAHVQIEAVRLALADRNLYLADPATMTVDASDLLDAGRIARMAASIDPDRVTTPLPGRCSPGGTAYICAADDDGLLISLMESNFLGFGSGVVARGTGIALHSRGAHFSLDGGDPNVIGPGKQPQHTLIPAMALRDGAPHLLFGTMGGDGQAQTHVQLLSRLTADRDADLAAAISAPRWVVDPVDARVKIEQRADASLVDGLRRRGHEVRLIGAYDYDAGNANAIELIDEGYAGASDPRSEGAVLGI